MNKKIILVVNILLLALLSIPLVVALDKSRVEIGADIINKFGITGKGSTICLIDDGVDYTNEYLGECTPAQYQSGTCSTIVAGKNIRDGDIDILPKSYQEHGTHVAGILISSHPKYKGISPDAKLAVVKVYSDVDDTSSCQGFLDAINWCVNNSGQYNISVISLSYGLDPCENSYTSQFQKAINNATAYGISFIKSSGNTLTPSLHNMTFPAQLNNVTTVGSTTRDSVSIFTRRLPTAKLDLLAPGHKIRSTKTGGGLSSFLKNIVCYIDSPFDPNSYPYNLTQCDSGTSYATPHVSAAMALLKQFDPALKPYDRERMLIDSGDDISDLVTGATFRKINLVKALHVLDWPTENHDFRRTGFTLLKGDMRTATDISRTDFVMEPAAISGQEQVMKAIVADVDGNGAMETVSFVHRNALSNQTRIYAVEVAKEKRRYETGYKQTATKKWGPSPITMLGVGGEGGATYFPGTLANIDSDSQKELIAGVRNGTVYAYDVSASGTSATQRWLYRLRAKWSPLASENTVQFNGGNAVVDIDLDGNNEIILADVYDDDDDWPGEVYVLKDAGSGITPTLWANRTFATGGAYATVSVANVDSDDNPEIIVPSRYGIYVFDYNTSAGSRLSTKWSNTDGRIESSALIADVDNDNQYEIVYTTVSRVCEAGRTCYNRTYVRDANTGALETQINLTTLPRPTPTVANLDSDANMEIIVLTQDSLSSSAVYGDIYCFDAVSGGACSGSWPYNDGGNLKTSYMSPNIADLDNDGNYNVVFAENDGNRVFVLNNDGTKLFNYNFSGYLDNGIAIADIDNDGVAELAVKRAGSPVTLFTTVSSLNSPPALESVVNLTAIAGELINLTADANIRTSDPNGNIVNVTYSAPFNSSGLWQTTVNDTGNYTILVEATDSNLTDYKYVDIMVFNENTSVQNKFSDGSSQTALTFPSSGNQTVQVRIPKNATVVYSKITVEGTFP